MKKIILFSALVYVIPSVTFAAFASLTTFVGQISDFINTVLIPLIFAVALLVFIYGMFKYFILGGGNESSREEGKKLLLWAIIGFVLMVSIWGVVNLFGDAFSSKDAPTDLPGGPAIPVPD